MRAEILRRYRHRKGGVYRVEMIARHTETGEELVIYVEEHGAYDCAVWARPRHMFEDGRFAEEATPESAAQPEAQSSGPAGGNRDA